MPSCMMAGTPGTLAPTVMSVLHGTLKVAGLFAASWNPEAQPTFFFFFGVVLFFGFLFLFFGLTAQQVGLSFPARN